jgi:hypothetical protein
MDSDREVTLDSKTCTKCGETKPATAEFFAPAKRGKFGLHSWCHDCFAADALRRRREADPLKYAILDSVRAEQQTWAVRGLRQCKDCGAILPATAEFFREKSAMVGGITNECKLCENRRVNGSAYNVKRKAEWHASKKGRERARFDELFARGLYYCKFCDEVKPVSEFVKEKRNKRHGLRNQCKACMAANSRQHRMARRYAPHRTGCEDYYDRWCEQPCVVCGERRSKKLIHAHHRAPTDKRHQINKLAGRGEDMLPILMMELSKCAPLCATCHVLVHDAMQNGGAGLAFDDLVEYVQREYVTV